MLSLDGGRTLIVLRSVSARAQYEDLPKFDQFPLIRFVKSTTSVEHASPINSYSVVQCHSADVVLNDAVLMLLRGTSAREFARTYGQSVVAMTYPHGSFC